jgi:hypothetical protein
MSSLLGVPPQPYLSVYYTTWIKWSGFAQWDYRPEIDGEVSRPMPINVYSTRLRKSTSHRLVV